MSTVDDYSFTFTIDATSALAAMVKALRRPRVGIRPDTLHRCHLVALTGRNAR